MARVRELPAVHPDAVFDVEQTLPVTHFALAEAAWTLALRSNRPATAEPVADLERLFSHLHGWIETCARGAASVARPEH